MADINHGLTYGSIPILRDGPQATAPTVKPQKCIDDGQTFPRTFVCNANCGILVPRQKASKMDGLWRGQLSLFFVGGEMSKGLQTLDFSFDAEALPASMGSS